MASKYSITIVSGSYGDEITVPEYDSVRVARAIVALDNAERKFERLLSEVEYNRFG